MGERSGGNARVTQQSLYRFGAKSRPRRWCSRLGRLALFFSRPCRRRERSFHQRPASPGGGGHLGTSAREPTSFPRWLSFPRCVRAAASSPASPPADISESSRPISTSLFPASSSPPGAGPLASGHPESSFIQQRWGFRGSFGCKLSAGCWVGPEERRALRRELPRGQPGRHSSPDRRLKGRRPPACRNRFPNRSASPASGCPARAGSASLVGDPAGTELSAWTPHASGFGAGARARVLTAAVSGLTLGPGTAPQGDPTRSAERSAGAGPRPKPGLLGSLGASLSSV